MEKIFLLMCFLGVAAPYYFLFKFLEFKNWEWSLSEFFADANVNFASSMLSADLGVAAMSLIWVLQLCLFLFLSFMHSKINL